jgi:O-succinylbenzoate synthase
VEIWSLIYGFVSPQQAFSDHTKDLAEQIMKQLVNDWAASQ